MKEKNESFSGSIMAPETMMNDDVDEMSMKIPVMGIIKMKMIFVLLSMERDSLQWELDFDDGREDNGYKRYIFDTVSDCVR